MPGVLLFLPFLLVRFGLLAAKNRQALPRAAHFAPMQGREKIAYAVYQLATLGILLALCASRIQSGSTGTWYGGLVLYLLGLVLCAVSVLHFAAPDQDGLNTQGIYRLSRNPMYLGYFVCFLGMALLTRSWVLLALVLVFQGSAHWIILAEERWCQETFGEAYRQYRGRVRRYL